MRKKLILYNLAAFAVLFLGMAALFIFGAAIPANLWGWALGSFLVLWFVIAWWGALQITPPGGASDSCSDN